MKVLKWVLIVVLSLIAILVIGGYLLSPKFTVARSVVVKAPPEKIYPLVAAPRAWKQWSVWNQRDPAMQIEYSGPESGVGATWAWRSKSEGNGSMNVTAAQPPQRVGFDLHFVDFGTTSGGEFVFVPEGTGTRVTWTMNGDMGRNPVWRWMGLMMDSLVGKDFEGGLANLKAIAEAK